MHYCNASLLQLEQSQLLPEAAAGFTLVDRSTAGRLPSPDAVPWSPLAREKSGVNGMQAPRSLDANGAPVMLATMRSTGPFQMSLRCLKAVPAFQKTRTVLKGCVI